MLYIYDRNSVYKSTDYFSNYFTYFIDKREGLQNIGLKRGFYSFTGLTRKTWNILNSTYGRVASNPEVIVGYRLRSERLTAWGKMIIRWPGHSSSIFLCPRTHRRCTLYESPRPLSSPYTNSAAWRMLNTDRKL